jgi:hypothetical protein
LKLLTSLKSSIRFLFWQSPIHGSPIDWYCQPGSALWPLFSIFDLLLDPLFVLEVFFILFFALSHKNFFMFSLA